VCNLLAATAIALAIIRAYCLGSLGCTGGLAVSGGWKIGEGGLWPLSTLSPFFDQRVSA